MTKFIDEFRDTLPNYSAELHSTFPLATYGFNLIRDEKGWIISLFEVSPFRIVCVIPIRNEDWQHALNLPVHQSISYPGIPFEEFLNMELRR